MKYYQYIISNKQQIVPDTYIFTLKPPDKKIFDFSPGQYVFLKNPNYLPEEPHPFSMASSPLQKDSIELCVKVYGDWTNQIVTLQPGDIIEISQPQGRFVWSDTIENSVFLIGGIGIAPIMSILKYIKDTNTKPMLTMLYGNRTPQTIAYEKQLKELSQVLPLKIVYIFSDLNGQHDEKGYQGFITKDIIQTESPLSQNSTFFVIGPPIFVGKMLPILKGLGVDASRIKTEDIK